MRAKRNRKHKAASPAGNTGKGSRPPLSWSFFTLETLPLVFSSLMCTHISVKIKEAPWPLHYQDCLSQGPCSSLGNLNIRVMGPFSHFPGRAAVPEWPPVIKINMRSLFVLCIKLIHSDVTQTTRQTQAGLCAAKGLRTSYHLPGNDVRRQSCLPGCIRGRDPFCLYVSRQMTRDMPHALV